MIDAHATGAPTVIAVGRHPITQGQAPPLVRHRRRPGESLSYADASLSLLLCHDADFWLADWCRASSPSHVVITELEEQLLAQERELDS
jgi:hypothetical protein